MRLASGATVEISCLTIANGHASANSGGIYNAGKLIVSDSTIAGCFAGAIDGAGGGIYNAGRLTVSNSTIAGNSAGGSIFGAGGGIFNSGSGVLTVSNCTVSENHEPRGSFGLGGGIYNEGALTVDGSTVSGNHAGLGGGIYNGGALTVMNSTIAGNGDGLGTIYIDGVATATISNSTISGNSPSIATGRGTTVELRNTIISGNGSRPNLFADAGGTFVSDGHNLSNDDGGGFLTSPGDLTKTDPLLGPLQDNCGPTQTMALLPGSPAVDAGDNTDAPYVDQRGPGYARIVGGTIDIGAFEVQPGPATHFHVSAPARVTFFTPFSVTVTALDVYGHRAAGYVGTVTFGSTDSDPWVVLPVDYSFTAEDQGVYTFVGGFTLITAGVQTITATATNDNAIVGDAVVTVGPVIDPLPCKHRCDLKQYRGSCRTTLLDRA